MHLAIIYAIKTLLNFWHYNGSMTESKTLSPFFSVFHLPQCQFLPKCFPLIVARRLQKYQMSHLLSTSPQRRKSNGICRFDQENEEHSSPKDPPIPLV